VRPLVVVEASSRAVADVRSEIEAAGWRVVQGWRGEPGIVCAGIVEDAAGAAGALLAAIGGAGLLVEARAGRELVDRLVDDLRRLGRVEHRVHESDEPALTREERELLALLAEGTTLGVAARTLHVSRRTADRRLASAREKLGVATTAEAVVALARLTRAGPRR
jgi:DNA-binding CsgD family transcriptional regulator